MEHALFPSFVLRFYGFVIAMVCADFGSVASAASADLNPLSGADGVVARVNAGGALVWQNTGSSLYMYFQRPSSFPLIKGQTLYVRVTYYDDGDGQVGLQYDAASGAYTRPAIHSRTSRVNTDQFVSGYFELPSVEFSRRENLAADFRLICGAPGGVPISIRTVTLQDSAFDDPQFQTALSRSWESRYRGASRDYIDRETQTGKVMVGYQGWFRAPNDLYDGGWVHWARNNSMTPENFTVDMWPELSEYAPYTLFRAGSVVTRTAKPAFVFSSASLETVRLHFRWMRKHNIDGAFVQRFGPNAGAKPEWVLRHVSESAAREGLIWAIEYDVSGMADATVVADLRRDWQWLVSTFRVLEDPRYARHAGKPVVAIWGFPFADRNFTAPNANAAVDYFLSQNVYLIGGIPNSWRSLSTDWQDHMKKYDGILVWQSQNFSADRTAFTGRGQDFYPHTWPGFSWANLQRQTGNTQLEARRGGQTYWDRTRQWINAGCDRLFVGMFDEYDEGTAIMPMSDDPPNPPPSWGRFITNEGRPVDWWMMLTDELKRMMLGQRLNTSTMPTEASLSNRSNIGAEATVDLGTLDAAVMLSLVDNGDGHTLVQNVGGRECRANADPSSDLFMYFDVLSRFTEQLGSGDVTIEVEFFDGAAGATLGLQFDSTTAAYQNHPHTIATTGSNQWRTVRFEIADAQFSGRQNGGADFRLVFTSGSTVNINRVWLRLPAKSHYAFGTGVSATYFDNADLTGPSVARRDGTIDFDWGAGSPHPTIGPDTFSARWVGQLQAVYSGEHTFTTTSSDGVRLWINNQNIINNWTDHSAANDTGTISLEAGKFHDFKLEYYESGGDAMIRLYWTPPGRPQEVVPTEYLDPFRPADDSDGDGVTNAAESLAGTIPDDATSVFRILELTVDPTTRQRTLTWPTVLGIPYRIRRSSDLKNWILLSNTVGDGTLKTWTDTSPPTGDKRFYHVSVW
ncbi:MAG: PA14 domain-containing protein [Verrucomicrobiales bacterium]